MNINIYQIFYDVRTRAALDPGFIPLDNSDPKVKGWYEFWPILNFLNNQKLNESDWYGFLSPKFESKIGISSKEVMELIEQNSSRADVLLLSSEWDQISYFKNVFEQGEMCHPGIKALSQRFLDSIGLGINLDEVVMDASNSVFSNYVIAKKGYWDKWREYAQLFFDFVTLNAEYNKGLDGIFYNNYPMKAFIQERLASVVLATSAFPTINIDQSDWATINTILFDDSLETRKLLKQCNELKSQYRRTGNPLYLDNYWKIRGGINLKNYLAHQTIS
jgi:hypothetical protein